LPKRRKGRILLFPFLIPAFIVGMILYVLGEPKTGHTKVHPKKPNSPRKTAPQPQKDPVEMGLMAELEEEQVVAS
jgi:hypothetical protein